MHGVIAAISPLKRLLSNPRLREFARSFTVPTSSYKSSPCFKLAHNDWLSPNDVLRIFEPLHHPHIILSAWDQYSRRRDFRPTEPIFTLIIQNLACADDFDAVDGLMSQIRFSAPCKLSEKFFFRVIKAYGSQGRRINRAIELLLDMPSRYGCWPAVRTFNFVLNLLVTYRHFDEAGELYLKAPMLGVKIDSCCLNILLKCLCEMGDFDRAYKVFDEFPHQHCSRNVRSYATMMHGLFQRGRVKEALLLFTRMEDDGIELDTIAFNVVIAGLRKNGLVHEGTTIFERMNAKGYEHNEATYLEVLYGMIDESKFMEAKGFLGLMVSAGHKPSVMAFKKLVAGFCKEKLVEEANWVLQRMVNQGYVPRMSVWKQIVSCVVSRENRAPLHLLELLTGK